MKQSIQDAPFASLTVNHGVEVRNSEHEADGSFRRFITTKGGIEFTLNNDMPFEKIGAIAALVDTIALANFEAGQRAAKAAIRAALGITS